MDQQFRAALAALNGTEPTRQSAANLWLNDFQHTPEAWGAALALLDPASGASADEAFFAANLLTSKTRREWGRLNAQQRSELAEAFSSKLHSLLLSGPPSAAAAVPPHLSDRLVLLAATAAVLGGTAAAGRHLGRAQEVAAAGRAALTAPGASPGDMAGGAVLLRCSLLMLQHLAEEADELD
ncbi:hypothetical protein Agub_g7244, partial [Astrephomene gubernaculifera]